MDHAVEIDGVAKSYKGFAFGELSLRIPRGHIMGLIGPNGAGKTTLIKLMLNLVRRDAGSIRIFGLDNLAHEAAIKARIGFVPDEPCFHGDVPLAELKAVTAPFYPLWDEARFGALAAELDLPMQKRFKTLSHGTKTKFALALALARGAELVVLDEPTSGLDPVVRRTLLDLLAGLLEDERVAVLFSTHITSDLERTADFITFMREGRVVFSRPKDEVLETWRVIRGGTELLNGEASAFFEGLRITGHGFDGLTSRLPEAQRRFGDRVVYDRASLDDIMYLTARGKKNAV